MTEQATTTDELAFIRPYGEQEKQILTAEAVEFLTELVTHFTPQRNKLLAARIQQQQDIDNTESKTSHHAKHIPAVWLQAVVCSNQSSGWIYPNQL